MELQSEQQGGDPSWPPPLGHSAYVGKRGSLQYQYPLSTPYRLNNYGSCGIRWEPRISTPVLILGSFLILFLYNGRCSSGEIEVTKKNRQRFAQKHKMASLAFDTKIEKLCEERKVPGVVFAGGDAEGMILFSH